MASSYDVWLQNEYLDNYPDRHPILDVKLYKRHMKTFFASPLLSSYDFIIIQFPPEDYGENRASDSINRWFFGESLFPDMIVILAKRGLYYLCNQHAASPLSVILKSATEALGFKPEIHVKTNDDDGALAMERITNKLGKLTNIGVVSTSNVFNKFDPTREYQSPVFSKWLQKQSGLHASIITDEVLFSLKDEKDEDEE